jgi:hypothetical protein
MARRRSTATWRRVVLVVVALLVINVPYFLHVWQVHRAETEGVRVTASVTDVTRAGGDAVVTFRLPRSVDSSQDLRSVRVVGSVGAGAARTRQLEVRVLAGHPSVFHVDGEVRSWGGLLITLVADLLVLVMVLLAWRLGGRLRRPPLEAVALGDLRSGEEGSLLDPQVDGSYLINGEVAEASETSVLLRLRDRDVTVHLREHHNTFAVGDRAQVRAHLVG